MKIGFRADGGPSIGFGHVMRCRAIAEEFSSRGFNCCFITREPQVLSEVLDTELEIITLSEPAAGPEDREGYFFGNKEDLKNEIKELEGIIKKYDIEILIIDSYNVTEDYFLALKNIVPFLCYIDDENKYTFAVDMIINHNPYAPELKYESHYPHTKYLLGSKYTILRREFRDIKPIEIRKDISKILITIGGSDPHNLTGKLIDMINSDPELGKYHYNIVIGEGFKYKTEVTSTKQQNLTFHQNIRSMSGIMLDSDLAISGGGSTIYELSACGVPTMAFILADNQEIIVEKMYQLNAVDKLGWYHRFDEQEIKNKLKAMISDFDRRMEFRKNSKTLADGQGVIRIVDEILSIYRV